MNYLRIAVLLALGFDGSFAAADVTLPKVFSDGMVLQRGTSILIWGEAPKGEKVTITFRGATGTAESDGKWKIELPAQTAGGPYTMTVQGANKIDIKDIYIGDVWLASGQSNMDVRTDKPVNDAPRNELLRQFNELTAPHYGQKYTPGIWTAGEIWYITAWYFAKEIQEREKVPIGILCCAEGGTHVEPWAVKAPLYEKYIRPVFPYRIKGVIWWQGENNTWSSPTDGGRMAYQKAFTNLITGWRKEWALGDFPFLFVQLQKTHWTRDGEPLYSAYSWSMIRDGQRLSLCVTNTAMAVSFDVTLATDLHPPAKEKEIIGKRLALAAEALAYGKDKEIEWSGPLLADAKKEGDKITLRFTHTAKGLVAKGGEFKGFELWEPNKEWSAVTPEIAGDTLVVTGKNLGTMARVSYAYKYFAEGNFYNGADLPASPFITEILTDGKK